MRIKALSKFFLSVFLVFVVFVVLVGLPAYARKIDPTPQKPLVLRLGHQDKGEWPKNGNLPDSKQAQALLFKSMVEAKTNGAVKVEIFPNNILGDATQMLEMTKSGSLDMCLVTGVMGKFYPESDLLLIPYFFSGEDVVWRVTESKFWKDLLADMERKTNMKVLNVHLSGFRNFTNDKRPIHNPDDMKGLKIRVMPSPLYAKFIEALGANPTPIAWSELYTALQTKVVDGQENPISLIASRKFYEVQKYLTLDGHTGLDQWFVMNSQMFNALPKEYQNVLMQAARISAFANIAVMELRSYYIDFKHVAEKMEVYAPNYKEIEQFKEKAQPAIISWLKSRLGDKTVDEFIKVVEEAEKELGYK